MLCGLDIDGCLFDVITPTLLELQLRRGISINPNEIHDYHAHKLLNIDYEYFINILNFVWFAESESIMPYEKDVHKHLNRLSDQGHKIVIVTKRDIKTISNVINVLKRWKIKVDGIVCVNSSLEKTLINVDVMLDDSKDVTDQFGERGYLIKRSYNPHYDVESIEDFVNKVLDGSIPKT